MEHKPSGMALGEAENGRLGLPCIYSEMGILEWLFRRGNCLLLVVETADLRGKQPGELQPSFQKAWKWLILFHGIPECLTGLGWEGP